MWKPLRDENRLSILKIYGYTCDRLVREEERQNITSISRSQAWKLEREGNSRHVKLLERNPVDGY
ncbi:putative AlpA-family regulatory protein from prophage [Escherichia coli]|uniref:Putative AlpA-family regulatory protein from prophage n=1 Tax=Escherichia coli TaxID=562 RepID=A0A376ZVH2_ECOLX|nr:putative AlpA-family regulatory protein from prophage [Escherichia coli]